MLNDVFHALSDPTRREVLRLLQQGDLSAGELSDHFDFARSTMSGHFKVLKHAGLIVSEKSGTTVRYSLNVSAFQEAMGWAMDLLAVGDESKGKSKGKGKGKKYRKSGPKERQK